VSVRTAFGAMTSALSASLLARPDSARAHRLAVDAARRRLRDALSPDDHRYLEFQIWQEGLARYTELQMARIAARRFSASPALRALPDFTEYASEAESIERRLLAELRDLPLAEAKRVAFYPVGAAMALLLDATVPDWRARYFQHPFALDAHFH
jgi:hypothetical protein